MSQKKKKKKKKIFLNKHILIFFLQPDNVISPGHKEKTW